MVMPLGRMRSRPYPLVMARVTGLSPWMREVARPSRPRGGPTPPTGSAVCPRTALKTSELARVVLDDVLLADGRLVELFADRQALHGACKVGAVGLDPADDRALVGAGDRSEQIGDLAAGLVNLD